MKKNEIDGGELDTTNGDFLTFLKSENQRLKEKTQDREEFNKGKFNMVTNYINSHPSVVAYYLLYKEFYFYKPEIYDLEEMKGNFELLSGLYPNHPYTSMIRQMIESRSEITSGSNFIDFVAPNLAGDRIKISEEIKGKIALLDFWASWCGPCIKNSRKMIPIYEENKDRGFTVVGIAREFKGTEKLIKALEREKFPWLNLVELDDENQIWLKYNIPNAGGATVLVDKNGKILAINPSEEKVKELLQQYL